MSAKETTENFWKIWNDFQWPDPKPPEFRLYYHEDGSPIIYTMEDLPGQYIEVDREIYLHCPMNVRVVDGKLQIIPAKKTVQKLMPNQQLGTRCDPRDICIVVRDCGIFWSMQDHEIND